MGIGTTDVDKLWFMTLNSSSSGWGDTQDIRKMAIERGPCCDRRRSKVPEEPRSSFLVSTGNNTSCFCARPPTPLSVCLHSSRSGLFKASQWLPVSCRGKDRGSLLPFGAPEGHCSHLSELSPNSPPPLCSPIATP